MLKEKIKEIRKKLEAQANIPNPDGGWAFGTALWPSYRQDGGVDIVGDGELQGYVVPVQAEDGSIVYESREGWDGERVSRGAREAMERWQTLRGWARAVRPPDPDHWREPEGCNVFPEPAATRDPAP
jgi:hypothetical protein